MSEPNPYASPVSEPEIIVEPRAGNQLVIASRGQRFVNLLIDNIVIRVIAGMAGFAIGVAYATNQVNAGETITADDEALLNLVGIAVGLVISVGYFIAMEAAGQRTIGKYVSGTRVVTPSGGRPSLGQVVGRSFARLIPFEAFSFLSKDPVGWHDSLSGTRVVKMTPSAKDKYLQRRT